MKNKDKNKIKDYISSFGRIPIAPTIKRHKDKKKFDKKKFRQNKIKIKKEYEE